MEVQLALGTVHGALSGIEGRCVLTIVARVHPRAALQVPD
jgi:hypothetical protein